MSSFNLAIVCLFVYPPSLTLRNLDSLGARVIEDKIGLNGMFNIIHNGCFYRVTPLFLKL